MFNVYGDSIIYYLLLYVICYTLKFHVLMINYENTQILLSLCNLLIIIIVALVTSSEYLQVTLFCTGIDHRERG
jgi:hypothetical protein